MRRLSISLYLLVALAELIHWAIVPLIPAFAARFSLSEVQSGALVASTGLATLVVSVPAGMLADRLGARRLTLWAGAAMTIAAFGQALAPTYALLLGARLLFGIGFGIVWTSGLAWLSAVTATRRSRTALGATVTSAGVGTVVAPGFAGAVSELLGLAAPFVVAGAAAAAVTVVLATAAVGPGDSTDEGRPSLAVFRAAYRDPALGAAMAAILLGGLAGGMISLLAPLELHVAGFSGASIGLIFSIAALLFIVGSALTVWAGERAVKVPAVLVAAVSLALALSPATVSGGAIAVVTAVCLSAPVRAFLYTASYPLGAAGGERAAVGAGTVMGLLNGAWALTTVIGPLSAGALAQTLGERAGYGVLQALAAGVVGAVWLLGRAPPRVAAPTDI
jgi:MFS transporter, ACS family, D-galactonate transporter